MLLALMKKPSWYDLPALPFPELPYAMGPFFEQGLSNSEPACYSNEECNKEITARLPQFMKEEFPPSMTVTKMAAGRAE
ncbi:MAG: hypothetical protein SF187_04240 [Deltaproteobacteria bacterium]|nr:hypothetical protein [Deltaproteobacteria bacterium]